MKSKAVRLHGEKDLRLEDIDLPQIKNNRFGLIIDNQTRKNLEITATQKNGKFHGSLLWAIDKTLTAMGGRCIRRWIEEPLKDVKEIKKIVNK